MHTFYNPSSLNGQQHSPEATVFLVEMTKGNSGPLLPLCKSGISPMSLDNPVQICYQELIVCTSALVYSSQATRAVTTLVKLFIYSP